MRDTDERTDDQKLAELERLAADVARRYNDERRARRADAAAHVAIVVLLLVAAVLVLPLLACTGNPVEAELDGSSSTADAPPRAPLDDDASTSGAPSRWPSSGAGAGAGEEGDASSSADVDASSSSSSTGDTSSSSTGDDLDPYRACDGTCDCNASSSCSSGWCGVCHVGCDDGNTCPGAGECRGGNTCFLACPCEAGQECVELPDFGAVCLWAGVTP